MSRAKNTRSNEVAFKPFKDEILPLFESKLKESNHFPLRPNRLEILQVNLGYMCNQACAHCHVDAGPNRKEIMTKKTMFECLRAIKNMKATTLDLTGGAPEMNPHFKWFVEEAFHIGIKDLIVRSNLTIMRANKKYFDLPAFFKDHKVHVISSLPHWTEGKTDRQRGSGVFNKSIEALHMLNNVGYGMPGSSLKLDLVYNPSGAFLPSDQKALEADFKKSLKNKFDIHFHNLYALTNIPINRFLDYLIESENYEDYMSTLVSNFNQHSVNNLMCKNTLSVGWDGVLYDCDFNQMLKTSVSSQTKTISQYNEETLNKRTIVTAEHCYGCTAGSGSSCQGAVI